MKKVVCILLAALILLSMAACGSKQTASTTTAASTADSTAASTASSSAAASASASSGSVAVELSGPVTVNFWHCIDNETEVDELNTLVSNFNNGVGKDMGITVNAVYQGSVDDLGSAVTAAIKAGNVPNVIMCEGEDTVQYLQADCVVDLTPYIQDKDWGLDLTNYYDAFINPCSSFAEEGYYMLPFMMSGEVLYYNKDFFDKNNLKPATTWEEYEELCRTISGITKKPAAGWDEGTKCFTTLMEQYAGGYTDKDGKLLFADNMDAAEKAVSWYQGLVNDGVLRIPGEDYYFSGPFANQVVQMYIGSGNEGQWITPKIPADNSFSWSCAAIPQPSDGTKAVYSEAWDIAMLDQNEDMQTRFASWVFMHYLQSDEAVMEITTHGGHLPFTKSVAESADWKAAATAPQLAGFDELNDFYTYYAFDNGSYNTASLKSDVTLAMDNILGQNADVKTTLENLVAAYQ